MPVLLQTDSCCTGSGNPVLIMAVNAMSKPAPAQSELDAFIRAAAPQSSSMEFMSSTDVPGK